MQTQPSEYFFQQYGNMSAPSCFIVMHDFLKNQKTITKEPHGCIVSFGAGYYMGSLAYSKH